MPAQLPEIRWIEAADNPWGVRLLDVRPITQGMLATSGDPQCAANAVSFAHDDGGGFVDLLPNSMRSVAVILRYRIRQPLSEGALFTPTCMEHKWAIFYRGGKILFVRSWTRQLYTTPDVKMHTNAIRITAIRGDLVEENEDPAFKARVADYMMRSHALDLVYPAPLPLGMEEAPGNAAMWCFHCFGDRALMATTEEIPYQVPEQVLRTRAVEI